MEVEEGTATATAPTNPTHAPPEVELYLHLTCIGFAKTRKLASQDQLKSHKVRFVTTWHGCSRMFPHQDYHRPTWNV
jgi:hypothetical protein